ncbi:MAG: nucleoside-triphosphatase [Eubacteriales bacterium]|nr:nucleoside-triphosphatase [Eubacteriales bacterium]MDD3349404.1 nucleoside-triphosphatase [Eubacteriales bacterium]
MHVFLKGPIQVGKSTALEKALERLTAERHLLPAGFLTHSGLHGDTDLYISEYGEEKCYSQTHKVAYRHDNAVCGIPAAFDSLGVELLHKASHKGDLLCMDELGFLEKDALQFQSAVLSCLDFSIPILGVLKEKQVAWHEQITSHPSVIVLEITLENRNEIPEKIFSIFDQLKPKHFFY